MKIIIGFIIAFAWYVLTVKAIECHDETIVQHGMFWHKDKKYEVKEVE